MNLPGMFMSVSPHGEASEINTFTGYFNKLCKPLNCVNQRDATPMN